MNTTTHKTPVFSVSQITNAIKLTLEKTFRSVAIQGEISNFKQQSSGHLYFTLKDADAQISAVMFRGNASYLKSIPKDGDNVIVKGEINVYPPSGRYQIIVRELELVGLGELLLKLEKLKRDIQKRGWFNKEFKKPLPTLPRRIGVVTSPTGAAIQDMLNVLTRRFGGVNLLLNPVRVQGAEAPGEIARAIEQFNEHKLADVLIIGRGGGSIEDLWAFNEEIVAEAIFKSKIPIVCAVGHETDHCIAEYVADVRAPTPSAAAEIVMAEKEQQIKHLGQLQRRLEQFITHQIKQQQEKLYGIVRQPVFSSPYAVLGPWMQKLDILRNDLDSGMKQQLTNKKLRLEGRRKQAQSLQPLTQLRYFQQKLQQLGKGLDHAIQSSIHFKTERFKKITDTLHAIDPKKLLTKGYSIVFSEKDGSVINSIRTLTKDDRLRLLVSDGEVISTVNEIVEK